MARRKAGFSYHLDCGDIFVLSDDEIVSILRAADPIIATGGRTLLSKIFKGSKDKAVLTQELDDNPFYGAFANKPIGLIMNMIDRCIMDNFLRVEYEGRMPVLFYTDKGWEIEKNVYSDELLSILLSDASKEKTDFIERMLTVNPKCVLIALEKLGNTDDPKLLKALAEWQPQATGKVKKKLNYLLR